MSEADQPNLTTLTVQLLSAYVSNNPVPSNELGALIQSTRQALARDAVPAAEPGPEYVPAVTVRKSLASKDYILSLIDGKPYKTLKRHLATHGMTPAEYRQRYNLAKDYPMVAFSYSEHRRNVAQRLGLGRKRAAPSTGVATLSRDTVSGGETAKVSPKSSRMRKSVATAPALPKSAMKAGPADTAAPSPTTEPKMVGKTPVTAAQSKAATRKASAEKPAGKARAKAKPTTAAPKINANLVKAPQKKRESRPPSPAESKKPTSVQS